MTTLRARVQSSDNDNLGVRQNDVRQRRFGTGVNSVSACARDAQKREGTAGARD